MKSAREVAAQANMSERMLSEQSERPEPQLVSLMKSAREVAAQANMSERLLSEQSERPEPQRIKLMESAREIPAQAEARLANIKRARQSNNSPGWIGHIKD